jgi:RNA polymerase sigma factor (sigma-70 family)
MSSRHDQIARFYEHNAAALQRAVARSIVGPAAMIEDACSHAWCQLLAHPDVQLGPNGFGWLYLVAKREAFRLSDRARREPAAGEPSELPDQPAASGPDAWQVLERRLTHQDRASVLAGLSERKQRLLVLHAAGYSYAEIVALTGDSPRTVERQLLRGRRTLRRHQATRA